MSRANRGSLGLLVVAVTVTAVLTSPLLFVVVLAVPAGSSGGVAPAYCFGYATDTPKILETIRTIETGSNYTTTITTSTASGAYAFVDASWRHYAQLAGVDITTYPRAKDAPPELQDQTAAVFVNEILERSDGRISAIPVTWYIGHEPAEGSIEWDTVPVPTAGNVLTPRQYLDKWMGVYTEVVAANSTPDEFCQSGGGRTAGDPLNPLLDDTGRAWSVPVTADRFNPAQLDDLHHDYPAWDLIIPEGVPIYAVTDGTVASAGAWNHNWWQAGCGEQGGGDCSTCGLGVTIQSDNGLRHTYCHNSATFVNRGDDVAAGQQIALSGDTGRSGTPHLHLELRINDTRYCPQPIMQMLYSGHSGPFTWTGRGCSF